MGKHNRGTYRARGKKPAATAERLHNLKFLAQVNQSLGAVFDLLEANPDQDRPRVLEATRILLCDEFHARILYELIDDLVRVHSGQERDCPLADRLIKNPKERGLTYLAQIIFRFSQVSETGTDFCMLAPLFFRGDPEEYDPATSKSPLIEMFEKLSQIVAEPDYHTCNFAFDDCIEPECMLLYHLLFIMGNLCSSDVTVKSLGDRQRWYLPAIVILDHCPMAREPATLLLSNLMHGDTYALNITPTRPGTNTRTTTPTGGSADQPKRASDTPVACPLRTAFITNPHRVSILLSQLERTDIPEGDINTAHHAALLLGNLVGGGREREVQILLDHKGPKRVVRKLRKTRVDHPCVRQLLRVIASVGEYATLHPECFALLEEVKAPAAIQPFLATGVPHREAEYAWMAHNFMKDRVSEKSLRKGFEKELMALGVLDLAEDEEAAEAEKENLRSEEHCAFCCQRAKPNTCLKACGRCRAIRYCSVECGKKHWKAEHKNMCKPAGV